MIPEFFETHTWFSHTPLVFGHALLDACRSSVIDEKSVTKSDDCNVAPLDTATHPSGADKAPRIDESLSS